MICFSFYMKIILLVFISDVFSGSFAASCTDSDVKSYFHDQKKVLSCVSSSNDAQVNQCLVSIQVSMSNECVSCMSAASRDMQACAIPCRDSRKCTEKCEKEGNLKVISCLSANTHQLADKLSKNDLTVSLGILLLSAIIL